MSTASLVSRHRPAVIAITGVAAALGIWTLYSTFADQTLKAPLHRSNAVRRSRRLSGDGPGVMIMGPTPEEPYGFVVVMRNGIPVGRIVYGQDGIPAPEDWQSLYGGHAEHARACVARIALRSVMTISTSSLSPVQLVPDARLALGFLGIDDIGNAILSDLTLRSHPQLLGMLDLIGTHNAELERLATDFLGESGRRPDALHSPVYVDDTEIGDGLDGNQAAEPAQGLKGLLYYIAEEKAKREAYEHRGIRCDSCSESPIRGIRWHCLNCPDADLCSTCEASFPHQQTHVFVKVKIPLPAVGHPGRVLAFPVWYPGNPHILHEPIQPSLRKRLAEQYHYEEPQIDALYDQFITTANVSYDQDPSHIKIGIDRRAFDSALTIEAWTEKSAPNALYDRMFAFYDRGNKGAILFEDFIDGMTYLRGPSRFMPLNRALQGFDIDGDGFVDRGDFLLLLRAKYDVQKALIAGASGIRADKISQEGVDVLKSSQPISAIFCEQDMPQGEQRSSGGKQRNDVGDLEPLEGTKTLLDDNEVPAGASARADNVFRVHSLPQLQRQLARLDRALHRADQVDEADSEEAPATQERVDSLAAALSAEEAAVLGVATPSDPTTATSTRAPRPSHQNALWKYTETSYNSALDPIFAAREHLDREVTRTDPERQRWQTEIATAAAHKAALEEQLRTGAELDPLVAAAANSHDRSSRSWIMNQDTQEQRAAEVQREIDVQMRDSILPTDTPGLDQFEAEIKEQSLEDLLAAAGYSVADEQQDGGESEKPAGGDEEAAAAATEQNGSPASPPTAPPTQQRLEHLASLDEEAKLMEARGGAGRMAFDEIIGLANADQHREVRGLIVSWLELASF